MSEKLVLYFSVYGTTEAVAEEIARQTDAELTKIEPVVPYDSNRKHYNALARVAKKELEGNLRPKIKNKLDIAGYQNIFIGFPIWWYTLPMILYTLFDQYDFSEKNLIPFNTHMGSRDGGTYQTIQKLEPNATVLKGLPIEMSYAERDVSGIVKKWLGTLNLRPVPGAVPIGYPRICGI